MARAMATDCGIFSVLFGGSGVVDLEISVIQALSQRQKLSLSSFGIHKTSHQNTQKTTTHVPFIGKVLAPGGHST